MSRECNRGLDDRCREQRRRDSPEKQQHAGGHTPRNLWPEFRSGRAIGREAEHGAAAKRSTVAKRVPQEALREAAVNFTHYDLGVLSGGATVIVTLQGTANVRLTDRQLFGVSRERSAPYIGGHATRSPARLQVP